MKTQKICSALLALGLAGGLSLISLPASAKAAEPPEASASSAQATTSATDRAQSSVSKTPSISQNLCSEYVSAPPVLASDHRPDGSAIVPAPNPQGQVTPVVFVHGWVSWVTHDEKRTGYFSHYINSRADGGSGTIWAEKKRLTSLLGLIQQVPGAKPYLFDYSQVASRWVTDPQIGPRLGQALQCLAKAYGVKPIVIAHSMGGNATRQALSLPDQAGGTIADHVAAAITIGTPNTGSDAAALGAKIIEGAGKPKLLGIPARLLKQELEKCGAKKDRDGSACLGQPVIDAFYSEGGKALRTGSPEMAALPKWPKQIPVHALAGDIKLGGLNLFGWESKRAADLGDLLVSENSALAGATDSQVVRCEYGVISKQSILNPGKIVLGLLTKDDRPATLLKSPCWHEGMLREATQTNQVQKLVSDYVTNPTRD